LGFLRVESLLVVADIAAVATLHARSGRHEQSAVVPPGECGSSCQLPVRARSCRVQPGAKAAIVAG